MIKLFYNKNKGFTLIELMVVIVLMSLLLGVATYLLNYSNTVFSKSNLQYNTQNEVRIALGVINKEVRNAEEVNIVNTLPDLSDVTNKYSYIYVENGAIFLSKYDISTDVRTTRNISGSTKTIINGSGLVASGKGSYILNIAISALDESAIGGVGTYNTAGEILLKNMKLNKLYIAGDTTGSIIEFSFASGATNLISSGKDIISFEILGIKGTSVGSNISVIVPFSATISNLTPTIEISPKATIAPDTGVSKDFTNPVEYTVIAEDGSAKTYTVTVTKAAASSEKDILSFIIALPTGDRSGDPIIGTNISLMVPYGNNLAILTPTIVVSPGATISPLSGTAQSFSSPKTYTVTAEDGTTKIYTITVALDANSEAKIKAFTISGFTQMVPDSSNTIIMTVPYGTDKNNLVPTITLSDNATILPNTGVSQNFTSPVTYVVTAEDGISTNSYNVTVNVAKNSEAKIKTLNILGQAGVIVGNTVAVTLPYGTAVTNIAPTITLSDNAIISPSSGTGRDFTTPKTYVVTAEDGISTNSYIVTVKIDKNTESKIKTFTIPGYTGIVGGSTVTITVPYGMPVTSITPAITLSDYATISPASGVSKNFTSPVTYEVTAQDLISKTTYSVSIIKSNIQAPSGLNATSGSKKVTLNWTNNSPYASGFTIQRADNEAFTNNLKEITVAANLVTKEVTNLESKKKYYFRIRAYGSPTSDVSGWSAIVSVTVK